MYMQQANLASSSLHCSAQAGCLANGGVPQERGRGEKICHLPWYVGIQWRPGEGASQVQHKNGGSIQEDAAVATGEDLRIQNFYQKFFAIIEEKAAWFDKAEARMGKGWA